MKNNIVLTLFQGVLSVVSSILISNMSFIGRLGISLQYREYLVFKTWWKTALLLFAVQFTLILVLATAKKLGNPIFFRFFTILLFIAGLVGCYFTFVDFTTTNHKLMKQYFHFGFYLFWIGWFISCLYFMFAKNKSKSKKSIPNDTNSISQQWNNPK